MYIIKNAFRCIGRSKGRNILIGIIALVIIFQPELRDALEKVGTAPQTIKGINGQPRSLAAVTGAIGVLSESVCELAKDKTGANTREELGAYI